MLGAKDILVKITGNNTQFKASMAGASGSMKTFASTTATSTGVAATSTKAMSLSMAASLAIATLGITAVIAAGVALVGVMKAAVGGAKDDQAVTATTIALLEGQGIAWDNVSDSVNEYIESLQNLTGYGDTELQDSFNEFISAGMDVETALKATGAAASIAASGEMELSAASGVLRRQFQSGTSRLKNYGVEAENFTGILDGVNEKFGDGSHRATTFEGKMGVLTEAIMDQIKPLGNQLLPIMLDVLDAMVWGARNVLPPLIYGFKVLMIPLRGVIMNFKQIYEAAQMAWSALTGDKEAAKKHWEELGNLQKEFYKESLNTIKNVEVEAIVIAEVGAKLKENLEIEKATTNEISKQVAYKEKYGATVGMRAAEAGIDLSRLGLEGEPRKSGDWSIALSGFSPGTDMTNVERAKAIDLKMKTLSKGE